MRDLGQGDALGELARWTLGATDDLPTGKLRFGSALHGAVRGGRGVEIALLGRHGRRNLDGDSRLCILIICRRSRAAEEGSEAKKAPLF